MDFKYSIGQMVYYRDGDRGWESCIVLERRVNKYGHRFYVLDNGRNAHEDFLRCHK